jgi:hypothetical protein
VKKLDLAGFIDREIEDAEKRIAAEDAEGAFRHLERAHVLGQSSTYQHTRIHWLMLKHGIRERDVKEIAGQVLRIGGAATKTPLGIYPKGNTGGAEVSPFRPMPIDEDLEAILKAAERK